MTLDEANLTVQDAVQGEPGRDKYLSYELELSALLFMLWRNSLDGSGVVDDLLAALTDQSAPELESALTAAEAKLNGIVSVDEGDDDEVDRIVAAAMFLGAQIAQQESRLRGMSQVAGFQRNVVGQTLSTANNYVMRVAATQLRDALARQRAEPIPADQWAARAKALVLRLMVNNAAYWRIVANQFTGKAHHYGILRGSLERGLLGYQLVAILDHRTSDICWELHGRQFFLADAVDHLERASKVSIEQLPNVSPWAKLEDLKDAKTPDLVATGILVPPFHPHCRTTLKPIMA